MLSGSRFAPNAPIPPCGITSESADIGVNASTSVIGARSLGSWPKYPRPAALYSPSLSSTPVNASPASLPAAPAAKLLFHFHDAFATISAPSRLCAHSGALSSTGSLRSCGTTSRLYSPPAAPPAPAQPTALSLGIENACLTASIGPPRTPKPPRPRKRPRPRLPKIACLIGGSSLRRKPTRHGRRRLDVSFFDSTGWATRGETRSRA